MERQSKSTVIVVSGPLASGKTTLVEKLSEKLDNAATLIFDQYDRYAIWPQDFGKWLEEGADPNQVTVPKMIEDLQVLLAGEAIVHPNENRKINPSKYILIEDPFGLEREEIEKFADQLIYINMPADVSVVRLVQRAMGMEDDEFKKKIEGETKDQLINRLESIATWLKQYMLLRSGFGITDIIKMKANFVVDGMKPIGEMVKEALAFIQHQTEKRK
jgi:deoxyadenosine/deoxycytidine kinase